MIDEYPGSGHFLHARSLSFTGANMKTLPFFPCLILAGIFALSALPLAGAGPAQAKEPAAPGAGGPIAYIYSTDAHSANFSFLTTNQGWAVTALKTGSAGLAAAAQTSFASYSAIILADDTGAAAAWNDTSAIIQAVASSGKHVLAVGSGGYAYLGKIGLAIGFPHGATSSAQTDLKVTNLKHPALAQPNPIKLTGDQLAVQTADSAIGIDISAGVQQGVSVLGVRPANASSAVILSQASGKTCLTLWGFTTTTNFTLTGQKLAANLLSADNCLKRADLVYTADDLRLALDLESAVTSRGFEMNYITPGLVAGTDFSTADVIIIADNTLNPGKTGWMDPQDAVHIRASGRPILGMGLGGAYFFGALGLPFMHNNNFGTTTAYQIIADDPTASYYSSPFMLTHPLPNPLGIYGTSSTVAGYVKSGSPDRSLNWIAHLVASPSNYPVMTEQNKGQCFIYWGFTYSNTASSLTTDAANLFANLATNPPCRYYSFLPVFKK